MLLAVPAIHGPGVASDVVLVPLAALYWLPYHRRARRLAAEGRLFTEAQRILAAPSSTLPLLWLLGWYGCVLEPMESGMSTAIASMDLELENPGGGG